MPNFFFLNFQKIFFKRQVIVPKSFKEKNWLKKKNSKPLPLFFARLQETSIYKCDQTWKINFSQIFLLRPLMYCHLIQYTCGFTFRISFLVKIFFLRRNDMCTYFFRVSARISFVFEASIYIIFISAQSCGTVPGTVSTELVRE